MDFYTVFFYTDLNTKQEDKLKKNIQTRKVDCVKMALVGELKKGIKIDVITFNLKKYQEFRQKKANKISSALDKNRMS
jgi:hypothetical protein